MEVDGVEGGVLFKGFYGEVGVLKGVFFVDFDEVVKGGYERLCFL